MVPPRLARKMSVMSVEPPARGAPGGTAAERVHRPGSRRLGGVEATGASPGVAASRPHRSDPRAGPVRRTPCARGAWGGERAGGWASDMPAPAICLAVRHWPVSDFVNRCIDVLALVTVRATRSYLATGRNERRGASFACAYRDIRCCEPRAHNVPKLVLLVR